MKKAAVILLSITAAFLCMIAGVMIGRFTSQSQTTIVPGRDYIVQTDPNVSVATGKLDINTATLKQLTDIPGIGQVIAQRILDYIEENGEFRSLDELLNVKGIGESRLQQLQEYLTVGG